MTCWQERDCDDGSLTKRETLDSAGSRYRLVVQWWCGIELHLVVCIDTRGRGAALHVERAVDVIASNLSPLPTVPQSRLDVSILERSRCRIVLLGLKFVPEAQI